VSIGNQIYEHAWSDRWCLAGSVTTSALFMAAGHSLKLIRDIDALTPMIRSAMNAKSSIPVVEINTPNGTLTLTNAKVVNLAPPAAPGSEQGGGSQRVWGPSSFRVGSPPPKHKKNKFEELEIKFTFQKISITRKSGKGLTDDWSSGG
jgi:hypothetical protein